MSSVCGKLDFESSSSSSSSTQCSNGSSLHFGLEESSQESDGDGDGYINQSVDEESADESNLGSLPPNSSEDENITTELVVLIPAVKGSREKHGLSLRKSSVTWVDDVYDPPPSIASNTRSKKKPQSSRSSKDNHKKTSKKGQKSKDNSSSRGGSSKDKKHSPRKHSREKFDWGAQTPIVAASS